MLGSAFTGTLREAQAGDEQAFTRLWRDANPLMVRYLRVVGADDPYDAACEGWITAVRGLTGFTGDEAAWRVWLLACARLRAEQGTERQRWATVTPIDRRVFSTAAAASTAATAAAAATMAGRGRDDDEFDIDSLLEATPDADPEHRGLGDTITALRALPLGQGEILVLRLGGGLPGRAVSDVVGTDAETVRRSETRALERLGADAELITWSLAAPATAAELADERVALGAFRSIPRPPSWSVPRTRVLTVGNAPTRRKDAHPSRGIANAAGRSRTALLGIATVSALVMSLGGLSAAAYVGALPDGVQQVMAKVIGAPEPGATRSKSTTKVAPRSPTASSRPRSSTAVGPDAASSPAAGLCRAWAADKVKGTSREASIAFSNLATTAGGPGSVEAYCAKVATNPAVQPTAQVPKPSSTGGKPTKTSGGSTATKTAPVPRGTGSPTRTGSTSETPSSSPTPQASQTKVPGKGTTRTKSPNGSSTKTKAPSADDGTTSTSTSTSTSTAATTPDPTSTTEVSPVG